jgi:hypothetical protein
MAPEYIRGQQVTEVGDVFAFGLVAHFAATGRFAFGAGATTAWCTASWKRPQTSTAAPGGDTEDSGVRLWEVPSGAARVGS